jgi:PAS domain S-box-containing protein
LRALLVTEDELLHKRISKLLCQFKEDCFEVEKFSLHNDVVEALKLGRYDVAFIDCQLGDRIGLELLQEINVLDAKVVVIVLLGDGYSGAGIDALKAGSDGYLDVDSLGNSPLNLRVRHIIERKRLRAVQDAAMVVNSSLELNQVLDRILANIGKVVSHDAASIMLVSSDVAHVVHFHGYKEPETELVMNSEISRRPDLHQILQSGQSLVIPDTQNYPDWPDLPKANWILSHVGVPLRLSEEIIGFLSLESSVLSNFSETHVEWLLIFAGQISSVLYNTRLRNDETRMQQEVKTLREITSLVTSTLEINRLMESLLAHLQTVISCDMVTIFLMEGEYLEVVASGGPSQQRQEIGMRFLIDRYALFRDFAKRGQVMLVPEIGLDARFEEFDLGRYERSWLGVPLLANGVCFGYMTMLSVESAAYGKEQAALVSTFANQAAIAIHNAQLYEEIRRYADELEGRVAQRTEELRYANQEIKTSEHRYRTLFESTFEGICVHDKGLLVDANPAFANMLGYSHSEIIGMSVLDLVTDESRDFVLSKIISMDERPYEVVGVRKDGSTFDVEIQGKKHIYEGLAVRVAAVRDITERKEAEQHRLGLALEKERMQILANFISNASHEFRTSLSVIGTSSYLLDRLSTSEEQQQRIRIIEAQVTNITMLVENMVTLSHLDGGEEALEARKVDINMTIRFVTQSMEEIFQEKNQQIVFEPGEKTLYLQVDHDYIIEAIKSLLDNAKRYTPVGGTITISTGLADDGAVIKIADNGIGIDDDALPHIFERFYRVDVAGTTRGFGLGLSIAKSIIEKHQGRIEVDTVPGKGSTFTIWLPLE